MKAYNAENIRNIVVAGHGGRGKTTLCEAMLYIAKATDRLGRVLDGNTVLDFDAEEKKRNSSVSMAMAAIEWKDTKINLLDTPGFFDFAGGMSEGMRAADCALIVTAAGAAIGVGAEKAFKAAQKRGISQIIAITKCDLENAGYYKTLNAFQEMFGTKICPVVVPYYEDGTIKCYVSLITNKAFTYKDGVPTQIELPDDGQIQSMRATFLEAVATADDELMEKFFEGEEFTQEEILRGLGAGVADNSVVPVYACSGYNLDAVDLILDAMIYDVPSAKKAAGEKAKDADGNEVFLPCDENGDLAAICFKTVTDPFVGKMSYFKVVSGKITPDVQPYNANKEQLEKMGKIIFVKGSKQEETACIPAGDIGVVAKLGGFRTGNTLCKQKKVYTLDGVDFPSACLSRAVKVRKKGEEEKVAAGMVKIMHEDPVIKFEIEPETREQIVSGLGEQHLDVVVSKLSKMGVDIDLAVPRVAYRETIRKKVEAQGRHKKQSGGHGQFGDIWVRFEPCEEMDLVFETEVVGGSVPKNYFPAVEKGLRESVAKGFLAGYPMVGVKAVLYDGSYHPVDSSEMAFKMAANLAFKNAMPNANVTIQEPIGTLKAYMQDYKMGDIMSDITKRRGRVLGMGPSEEEAKMSEIIADVPMAEMGDFATVLRSVTHGKGYFSIEFARYEDAPANIAQKVIEEAKLLNTEE